MAYTILRLLLFFMDFFFDFIPRRRQYTIASLSAPPFSYSIFARKTREWYFLSPVRLSTVLASCLSGLIFLSSSSLKLEIFSTTHSPSSILNMMVVLLFPRFCHALIAFSASSLTVVPVILCECLCLHKHKHARTRAAIKKDVGAGRVQ